MTDTDPNPAEREDSGSFSGFLDSAPHAFPAGNRTDDVTLSDLNVPDAIDSLLEILPETVSGLTPQAIASQVRRTENNRAQWLTLISRVLAFSLTVALVVAAFSGGAGFATPEERPNRLPPGFLTFHGLQGIEFDEAFASTVFDIGRKTVWDESVKETVGDLQGIARAVIDPEASSSLRKSLLASDFDLSEAEREQWRSLAGRIESLAPPDQEIVRNRIAGIRLTIAGLTDEERKRFAEPQGRNRMEFLVQKAQLEARIAETIKRPVFTIAELNRPDYLMDLALVTRAWNRMTPAQKRAVERRAVTAKTDPARKTERLRLLAQSLETDGAENPAVKAPGRAGPLQKAFARAEALKQDREKRRSDFQKIVNGNPPPPLPPEEAEEFLERMPPWLIESIDPMPPDEARRLLSLLKVLVGHEDEPADDAGAER